MKFIKKLSRIFYSMKLAIVILGLLLVACLAGSLIMQNQIQTYYLNAYSDWISQWILFLGLDHVFTTFWFILLAAILCINLICCSISRFFILYKQGKEEYTLKQRLERHDGMLRFVLHEEPQVVLKKLNFRNVQEKNGQYYAIKNKVGIWGSWLCHLGMLIIIVGFGLGQMYLEEGVVYSVAGLSKTVEGMPFEVEVQDFTIDLREDGTVNQYISTLKITNLETQEVVEGTSSVNHPLDAFGYQFLQNSTGWAADLDIYYQDTLLSEELLYVGEHVGLTEIPLALVFSAFYPDYYNNQGRPMTLSSEMNNPAVLFQIYYNNQLLAMDVAGIGYDIEVDDYTFVFNNPRPYTLIQIIRDPTAYFVAFGGFITLISLILSFYMRTEEVWIVQEESEVVLYAKAKKAIGLLEDQIQQKLGEK